MKNSSYSFPKPAFSWFTRLICIFTSHYFSIQSTSSNEAGYTVRLQKLPSPIMFRDALVINIFNSHRVFTLHWTLGYIIYEIT